MFMKIQFLTAYTSLSKKCFREKTCRYIHSSHSTGCHFFYPKKEHIYSVEYENLTRGPVAAKRCNCKPIAGANVLSGSRSTTAKVFNILEDILEVLGLMQKLSAYQRIHELEAKQPLRHFVQPRSGC